MKSIRSRIHFVATAIFLFVAFDLQAAWGTWGGGTGLWTEVSATGWDGVTPPGPFEGALVYNGKVTTTANNQLADVYLYLGTNGTVSSDALSALGKIGGLYFESGGTFLANRTFHYRAFGVVGLPEIVYVSGSNTFGAAILATTNAADNFINMPTNTEFFVGDITANEPDLTISAGLAGEVDLADTNYFTFLPARLVKTGAGTLALDALNNSYNRDTIISNGTIRLNGWVSSPYIRVAVTNATLTGSGGTIGSVVSDGNVNPGSPVGVFYTVGYTQNLSGKLNIQLASTSSFDQIQASGPATINGELNVSTISFSPASGNSFSILNASSVIGRFAATNLPALGSGLGWNVSYNPASVVLSVTGAIGYTWGGGVDAWTNTTAIGWNGGPPAAFDIARIYNGTVTGTTNGQLSQIYLYLGSNGTFRSGLLPAMGKLAGLFLESGGTFVGERTFQFGAFGVAGLPGIVYVSGSNSIGSYITTTNIAQNVINMPSNTEFFVGNVTGNDNVDLTVSAPLAGEVDLNDLTYQTYLPARLVKTGAGTMALNATASTMYTGGTIISNGTVQLNGWINAGTIWVSTNGTLSGTGGASSAIVSDGTMSPGISNGVFYASGSYTQNASGKLVIEIAGSPGSGQFDLLAVSGTARLGGALNVSLAGYSPVGGENYTFLTAGTVTGTFATTNLPALGSGLSWTVTYNPGSVVIGISGTPTGGFDAFASQIPNPADRGIQSDPEGDGFVNLLEYVTGGNPTNVDAVARMSGTRTNGVLALVFSRDTNSVDATLYVQAGYAITNNAPWNSIAINSNGVWTGAATVTESGFNPVIVTVQDTAPSATNRFLRLTVTRP
jgi:autotransporter-associated beta strand protein